MKDFNHKEDRFKSVLENLDLELDTNEVWNTLEPNLEPEKKKNRFVFWILTGLALFLVVAGIGIGLYLSGIEGGEQQANERRDTYEKQVVDHISNPAEEVAQTNTEDKQENEVDLSLIEKSENKSNTNTTDKYLKETIAIPVNDINLDKSIADEELPLITSEDASSSEQDVAVKPADDEIKFLSGILPEINLLPIIGEANFEQFTRALDFTNEVEISITEPVSKAKKWLPILAFNVGANKGLGSYSISDDELRPVYEDQFAKESTMPSWTASIAYGKENRNGWMWSVGLFGSQQSIRYNNQEDLLSYETKTGVSSVNIDTEGVEEVTFGDIRVDRIDHVDIRWHRHHLELDAQLGLSKTLVSVGRFDFGVSADIAMNLLTKSDGYRFDDEGNFGKIPEQLGNTYKKNTGAKFMVSAPIRYHMNNWSMSLNPYHRMGLGEGYITEEPYKLKNSQYGITLGVMYRPNWE